MMIRFLIGCALLPFAIAGVLGALILVVMILEAWGGR